MKQIVKNALWASALLLLFIACRKDYSCKIDGQVIGTCLGCDKKKKETFEATCTTQGGSLVVE